MLTVVTLLLAFLALGPGSRGMAIPKRVVPPCRQGDCLPQVAGKNRLSDPGSLREYTTSKEPSNRHTPADKIDLLLLTRLENLLYESAHIVAVLDVEASLQDSGLGPSLKEDNARIDPTWRRDKEHIDGHGREQGVGMAVNIRKETKVGSLLGDDSNFGLTLQADHSIPVKPDMSSSMEEISKDDIDPLLKTQDSGLGLSLNVESVDLGPSTLDGLNRGPSSADGSNLGSSSADGLNLDQNPSDGFDLGPNPSGGLKLDPNPADGVDLDPNPADGFNLGPNPADGFDLDPNPADGFNLGPNPADGFDLGPNPADGFNLGPNPSGGLNLDPNPADGVGLDPNPADGFNLGPNPAEGLSHDSNPADGFDLGPNTADGFNLGHSSEDGLDLGPSSEDGLDLDQNLADGLDLGQGVGEDNSVDFVSIPKAADISKQNLQDSPHWYPKTSPPNEPLPKRGYANLNQRLRLILKTWRRKQNNTDSKVNRAWSTGDDYKEEDSKESGIEKRNTRLSVTVALGTLSDLLSEVRTVRAAARSRQRSRVRLHSMGR